MNFIIRSKLKKAKYTLEQAMEFEKRLKKITVYAEEFNLF